MTQSTTMRDLLRTTDYGSKLLAELERIGPPDRAVTIPDASGITDLLTLLGGPVGDFRDVIDARPLIAENPDAIWLVERHVQFLRHYTGVIDPDLGFVELPASAGVISRFFFLYVYMCAFPNIRSYHQSLGISDEDSIEILSDLGRNMHVNRKRRGQSGLAAPWWLMLHFRGLIYQFGRLQFELVHLGEDMATSIRESGASAGAGDIALSIHIPDFMGPFPPAAIDDSIGRAQTFFRRHFPDHPVDYGVCYSWLLDDQLPHHLPDTSNIVQFQRRFHIVSQGERNNGSFATFIWGADAIPEVARTGASSLELLVVAHRDAGGAWGSGAGWIKL